MQVGCIHTILIKLKALEKVRTLADQKKKKIYSKSDTWTSLLHTHILGRVFLVSFQTILRNYSINNKNEVEYSPMNTEIRAICDAAAIAMTINIKIISSGYLLG